MNEQYQKVNVGGFLLLDNKLLVIRRSQKESFMPGYYELPGGKVNFGEDPTDGLVREFLEESNLKIKVLDPFNTFADVTENNQRHNIEIVYFVELIGSIDELKLSDAHDDFKWITSEEVSALITSDIMKDNIKKGFNKIHSQLKI